MHFMVSVYVCEGVPNLMGSPIWHDTGSFLVYILLYSLTLCKKFVIR